MRSRLSLGVERLEERGDLVVVEARQREVNLRRGIQLGKEASEQLLVPRAGDLVEGQIQQPGLVARQIQKDHRHRGESEPAGGEETLVPADDGLVLASRDNGIDEAELADGAGERVQLGVGDASGVGWIGPQVVDRDVDDGEFVVSLFHRITRG